MNGGFPKKRKNSVRLIFRAIPLFLLAVLAVVCLYDVGISVFRGNAAPPEETVPTFSEASEMNAARAPGVPLPDAGDDQRSTLWPLLVSLIIALVGSLITTYVFLKEALDRTSDEKAYYRAVIKAYREHTMHALWYCTMISLALIVFVIFLYVMLYFLKIRSRTLIREITIFLCVCCIGLSGYVLYRCIYIEKGLQKEAKKLLRKKVAEPSEKAVEFITDSLGVKPDRNAVVRWLQINGPDGGIGGIKFISCFSSWEKLAMMLVERESNSFNGQLPYEQIKSATESGFKIFQGSDQDIEQSDADANGWADGAYGRVLACRSALAPRPEAFSSAFSFLADCRDLIQVQVDTMRLGGKEPRAAGGGFDWIAGGGKLEDAAQSKLADTFLYFLLSLFVYVFRILPRIEVFFPSGKFAAANFYNVRFENSAFRASLFQDTVFARSKMSNSNFSMSRFERCEFFSSDYRNCSLSNTFLENCHFRETIFDDVDFTGAFFSACDLETALFQNAILVNITLQDTRIGRNDFTNSKIGNIELHYGSAEDAISFDGCNFAQSTLTDVRVFAEAEPPFRAQTAADPLVQELFGRLRRVDLKQLNSTRDVQSLLRRNSDAFCPGQKTRSQFLEPKISPGGDGRNSIIPHPVWAYIREQTVFSVKESIFSGAVLPKFLLYRANLEQSLFDGAQMHGLSLFCVYMPGCIMNGANLRESFVWAAVLQSAILENAIFFKAVCKLVNFEDAYLKELHASEAEIQYCSFGRSDCSAIDLTRAHIADSSFCDTILTSAEMTEAKFESVLFNNAMANGMLASYTLFAACSFVNADLAQSNFNYTSFRECRFTLTNFSSSTITNAAFEHCDFKDSNFRGICFIQAVFQDCANMSAEIFERCKFINCQFFGSNEHFEKALRERESIQVVESPA